jgi:hypothetical protein
MPASTRPDPSRLGLEGGSVAPVSVAVLARELGELGDAAAVGVHDELLADLSLDRVDVTVEGDLMPFGDHAGSRSLPG